MRYILALLVLFTTLPALAQSTVPAPTSPTPPVAQAPEAPKPPETTPAPVPRDPRQSRRSYSPMAGDFTQYTEGKIAFLRAELHITPEQESAFAAFVEILKKYSEGMNAHRETMREQRRDMQADNQLVLPTRLGLRIGDMEQDVQALKILQRALAEFYATLTDEQKKTADALLGHLAR